MNSDNTKKIDDDNGQYEVFNMANVPSLNDIECNHFFIEEVSGEIEGYTAWTCHKCHRGKYYPEGYKVINT